MSTVKVNELSTYSGTDISVEAGKTISGTASQFKMTDVVQGDVLYGSAADTLSRLAPGTAGQVLQTQGAGANPVWAADAKGKVLQVVQTVVTAPTASTTSTTFVDITGMTLSITPTLATSQVLVSFVVQIGVITGWHARYRLVRDSTAICVGDTFGSRTRATGDVAYNVSVPNIGSAQFLDSPATTSATPYKVQWGAENTSTIYLNRAHGGTDTAEFVSAASTITAMEIGV
jgi:hypothetical protein